MKCINRQLIRAGDFQIAEVVRDELSRGSCWENRFEILLNLGISKSAQISVLFPWRVPYDPQGGVKTGFGFCSGITKA
jgi:hypothetical protein